ncbi:MAG TPA: hypothetical protein VJI33_03180 [Candidatus Paceibacterota bacterium]
MIGKPNWFVRRKYGGWGLFPATWQGWVYLVIFVGLIFATQFIPGLTEQYRIGALIVLAIILVADTIDIMIRIKKDERETLHEALAERNALWVIIFILAAGIAYQAAQSAILKGVPYVDPVIIIAIVAGLIAKAATNIYLDKRN